MRPLLLSLALGTLVLACGTPRVTIKQARTLYEEYLKKNLPGFEVEAFDEARIPMEGLEEIWLDFQVFKARTTRVEGTYHAHTVIVAMRKIEAVWEGMPTTEQTRAVVDSQGLTAADEAGVRALGRLCLLLRDGLPLDAARIEVRDRDFVYHAHRLTLLSGRLGTYTEDLVVRFDEEGKLAGIDVTGFPDLTQEQYHSLVADPDPWLQLAGFVPDELKERVAAKAADRGPIQDHCR